MLADGERDGEVTAYGDGTAEAPRFADVQFNVETIPYDSDFTGATLGRMSLAEFTGARMRDAKINGAAAQSLRDNSTRRPPGYIFSFNVGGGNGDRRRFYDAVDWPENHPLIELR